MSTVTIPLKRVRRKIKNSQNPLFEKWLTEWREEAKSNGSDMQYCFNKALKSLQKFPLTLSSGKECIMLENFGAKICKMLDDRLEAYKSRHPEAQDKTVPSKPSDSSLRDIIKNNKNSGKLKNSIVSPKIIKNGNLSSESEKIKVSKYMPAYRSGSYAILITLLEHLQEDNCKGFLTKNELQDHAQKWCDVSFTKPLPGSYYTAWLSVGALLKKKLVSKEGNPARFSLTKEGHQLAVKLKEVYNNISKSPNPTSPIHPSPQKKICKATTPKKITKNLNDNQECSQTTKDKECVEESDETIFLLPGSFEIVLLVDTQERDCKHQQASSMTMKTLKNRNVNFEIRHLKVGDFIWIARDKQNNYELVLPYIVERKRMDDLASSIKDGRFHEQKFRLHQSGVENLIYLVEKYGNDNHRLGLPLPSLLQAMSNTQILNEFNVKVTNNHDDSMRYLDCMTTQLNTIFKNKTLMSCKKSNLSASDLSDDLISLMTFKDFNKGSEKNKKLTVRNMLIKHLIQLSGVSAEKATAITHLYPTPKALIMGLKEGTGEKSIADLTYGALNRSIGPAIAKQIHTLYTSLDLK